MISLPTFAQSLTHFTDLYQFEVVVANTKKAERRAGLVNALEQVMVRVTGDKRIGTHPAAADIFAMVDSLVQQYGYSERPVQVVEESADVTDAGADNQGQMFEVPQEIRMETVLSGRFQPAVMERVLRDAELPVWDARRPIVLVLASIEDGAAFRAAHDETVQPVLQSAATLRGIPLKFSESGGLDARTVWKGDRLALEDAAQAAGVDYVQWSRISRQSDDASADGLGWLVEAALYQNGELAREWIFSAVSEEIALRRLVDETANWMASRYAVVSRVGGSSVIGLHVSKVDNLTDYARVQKTLLDLGALEKIELVAVGKGTVIYRVTTHSDARQFEYALRLTRQLMASDAGDDPLQAPIWLGELELFYQLKAN